MKLSKHQTRVLAALFAIQRKHEWRWWGRAAIGEVVKAGGFHDVIQSRTMLRLRELGLVMLERQSWPPDVQRLVRCSCGMWRWGLTQAGAELADTLRVAWPADIDKRLKWAAYHDDWLCTGDGDGHGELFKPPDWGDDDDDDRGPSPAPAPTPLVPACV